MSVLKKIQFADSPKFGVAHEAIIGAGAVECQKPVHFVNGFRPSPCSIAAR
ncbi:MAG: hypothetical protein HGJ99_13650 [Thiobacillus sp.]|uniref:hypothetical protein n=1 Tax=Thiobacillus sp. TaxID=924 RepID=UPI0018457798|nr:hypothetical protein [Thiobacillus sp.]MBC2731808.1 hypothetical protein [Thiobacillus sp.]MBC2740546.1 hypothetical protein [Thiobacillus sp.]